MDYVDLQLLAPAPEEGAAVREPSAGATPIPGPAIFVSNFQSNTVQGFALTGTNLGIFCKVTKATGLAFDSAGNLFVASDESPYSILKFTPDGTGSIFATAGLKAPHAMVFDQIGNLYVANTNGNNIERITPAGVNSVFADVNDGVVHPADLSFDATGNLLIGDTNGDRSVNSADISQTKSQSGNPVTSVNSREDVNIDDSLDSADISLVKAKSGTALP